MNLEAEVISGGALLAFVGLALVIGLMGGMVLGRWLMERDVEAELEEVGRSSFNAGKLQERLDRERHEEWEERHVAARSHA